MAKKIIKDWKEVITYWDRWNESIDKARNQIETKYRDVNKIIADARIAFKNIPEENELTELFQYVNGIHVTILEDLLNLAADFVSKEIGLRPFNKIHVLFCNHWINSSFPVFNLEDRLGFIFANIGEDPNPRLISLKSKRKKEGNIENSITWDNDDYSIQEVAQRLNKLKKWPLNSNAINRHAGGRPSQQERVIPEAIVCYLLNRKAGFSQIKIGSLFGYKVSFDSYNRESICRTVNSRLKLADKIFHKYGFGGRTNI